MTHRPIPENGPLICRTCHQPVWETRVGDVTTYGHGINPTFQHHYARPKVAPESEAEKREAYGK